MVRHHGRTKLVGKRFAKNDWKMSDVFQALNCTACTCMAMQIFVSILGVFRGELSYHI